MTRARIHAAVALLLPLVVGAGPSYAADWSSCSYELDRVRSAARDASEAAQEVDTAENEFEDAKDDLQACISSPDIYDLMDDGCQSERDDYENALEEYRSRLTDYESSMETLASRLKGAGAACEL